MSGPYLATNTRSGGSGTNWAGAPSGTGFFDSLKYSFRKNIGTGFGNQAKGARMVQANPQIKDLPLGVQPYAAKQVTAQKARAAAGAGALNWANNFVNQRNAAQATLGSIMGQYAAADAPMWGNISDSIERSRQEMLARVNNYNNEASYARQGSALDKMDLGISQRVNTADMNMVQELLALNNQSFGVALTEGKGMLDRFNQLDQYAQENRQFDIRDLANQRAGLTEEKRLADFTVSGKAGAESGIASGAARMGFMANKTAEALGVEKINVLDARSDQELRKSLSENKFGRDKVNWDLQRAGISRREQELSLQSRQRALQAEADRIGISRKKLELQLAQRLNELNLSRFLSVGQFADAVTKGRMSFDQLMRDRATQLSQDPRAKAAQRTLGRIR